MKLYKVYTSVIMIFGLLSLSNSYGQALTKTKQYQFAVKEGTTIELNSKYTNIELELVDTNVVEIDAIMDVEGLTAKEATAYFEKWVLKTDRTSNKLQINTSLENKNTKSLQRHGYYQGFFIDKTQFNEIHDEIKNYEKEDSAKPSKEKKEIFDFDAYVKEGDAYLLKWQKINKKPIGKRWFRKTKKGRIELRQKSKKAKRPKKEFVSPKEKLNAKFKKNTQSTRNVRSLPERAIINKTLKIKIPKTAFLSVKARHGKIVIPKAITNLKADLSYILLQANELRGTKTFIKGKYSNFEISSWEAGYLETVFSNFTLIKKVESMELISNTSVVSIDKLTERINAKGNFKMLSIDASQEIEQMDIVVEDSKKVWIKLPQVAYNLNYEGLDSKLIHPEKFSLKTLNPKKQQIKYTSLNNNERQINIKSVSSTMQIYDIPWENLKIKSL